MTDQQRPGVLFLCIHNAGRSVAARVITDHLGAGRIRVFSGGSEPGAAINPVVAQVLEARGLSVADEFPKALDLDIARNVDIVITMGCGDVCPVFPGVQRRDWALDDPAGQALEAVELIVEEIERRCQELVHELLPQAG